MNRSSTVAVCRQPASQCSAVMHQQKCVQFIIIIIIILFVHKQYKSITKIQIMNRTSNVRRAVIVAL